MIYEEIIMMEIEKMMRMIGLVVEFLMILVRNGEKVNYLFRLSFETKVEI